MTAQRALVTATLVTALFATVLPGAGAAIGVSGKYGCSADAGPNSLLPTNARLTLKPTGRYSLALIAVSGAKSSGTYKKSGKKVKFSSGLLDGKTATFKVGGVGLAQLKFGSWINGGGKEVCRR